MQALGMTQSTQVENDALKKEKADSPGFRTKMFHLEEDIERHAVNLPQAIYDFPQTTHERAVLSQVVDGVLEDLEDAGTDSVSRTLIWNAARQLTNVRKMVELLSGTEGDLFRADQGAWGFVIRSYRPLAKRLRFLLSTTDPRVAQIFPFCELEPHVEVFLGCFQDLLGKPVIDQYANFEHAQEIVIKLNHGVKLLRERVRSEEFYRKIDALRRSLQKNSKSLRDYIDALFAVYSKLLVIRLDLTYKNAGKIASAEVAYQEVMQAVVDREAFFRKLKGLSVCKSLVGFVWKLEYGLHRGPHFHVILFLDGQKSRQDGSLAKTAGQLWEEVTHGRGDFFSCNAHKPRYGAALGIGMVEHDDQPKRARLQVAARYLVDVDFIRRLVLSGAYRTLGRGEMPSVGDTKLGRPRVG
jgi:hypothetical protein